MQPILLLLRAAALTDPAMALLRAEMDAGRLRRMRGNTSDLADAGHLRDGLTADYAAEVPWTNNSPELYELLVLDCGWPVGR